MNHPDFRWGGKIFASLGSPDASWGMVKLTPEQQHEFVEKAPGAFEPCNGAWGRSGCTNIHLPSAETDAVKTALKLAMENLEAKRPSRSAGDRPR